MSKQSGERNDGNGVQCEDDGGLCIPGDRHEVYRDADGDEDEQYIDPAMKDCIFCVVDKAFGAGLDTNRPWRLLKLGYGGISLALFFFTGSERAGV